MRTSPNKALQPTRRPNGEFGVLPLPRVYFAQFRHFVRAGNRA